TLSGLYIDGEFIPPKPITKDDPVYIVLLKLRSRPVFQEDFVEFKDESTNLKINAKNINANINYTQQLDEVIPIAKNGNERSLFRAGGFDIYQSDLDTLRGNEWLNSK